MFFGRVLTLFRYSLIALALAGTMLNYGCAKKESAPRSVDAATSAEVARVGEQAYIYLYPMVQNYLTMYQFSLDPKGAEYKGPMNEIHNVARVFTPADTTIVTANSDTPYSYLIMDLRAEPLVVTLPPIEKNRYYSLQVVDLYTFNDDYIGTRKDGNEGGNFLLAGPKWDGPVPPGVKRVVRIPTELAFGQFRTQLFNPQDLEHVKGIQAGYKVQPLSRFIGAAPPPPPPPIAYPPITRETAETDFWKYGTFLLQFAPPLKGEEGLRAEFARIGLVPGGAWPPPGMPSAAVEAVQTAGRAAHKGLAQEALTLKTSVGLFGTPEVMAGKYRERALGALAGIYGNDSEETIYPAYMADAHGDLLDGKQHNYILRFPPNGLPPALAFWSVTMYDGKTRLMVDNPLNRYLINSAMLNSLKRDADGSITLYLQHASPGRALESNWLPAPDGPMGIVTRIYLPKPEVLSGAWTPPPVVIATQ